jgi:DNA-binding SARP family transcriptional activator/tetratricopeptide (TPR) repeat protein/TolB-like protein
VLALRTLGTLDLTAEGGGRLHTVLAQPKRLALLAYLVTASPRGFHPRDQLLALFWPALDEEHARNSLSRSLAHLRSALGEAVVLARGAESVGVDAARLSCDVVRFETLLATGQREEALAVYGGDFLAGLFVSEAPDVEQWIDGERQRLRAQAGTAATALAEHAVTAGDLDAALRWAGRACELAPLDERTVRRRLTLLDRAGRRAEGLMLYEAFAARLATELAVEPDGETRALVETMRSRPVPLAREETAARAPHDGRVRESTVPATPDVTLGGDASVATKRARRRRVGTGAAVVALAVVVAGAAASISSRPRDGATTQRVLVAPFENRTGDPTFDLAGAMTADWVTQGLQQTGLLDVVDPTVAVQTSRPRAADSTGLTGPGRAVTVARDVGATLVVSGAIYRQGDSLYFRAHLTDVTHGREPVALDPVVVAATDPVGGAQLMRARVAGALATRLDPRIATLTAATDRAPTFEAYREYVHGLEAFTGAGNPVPSFEAAARLDTTFSLPLIWAVFWYGNHGRDTQRDSVIDVLAARRARLTRLDRYALDAFEAQRRHDIVGAMTATVAAARLSPGSNWSHNASNFALSQNRPREALRDLQQIDPVHGWAQGWYGYWRNRADALHLLGEYDEELRTSRRALALAPQQALFILLEIRALVALGRFDEADRRLAALPLLPPGTNTAGDMLRVAALELRAHGQRARAERTLRQSLAWYASDAPDKFVAASRDTAGARRLVRVTEAITRYDAGRSDEARALFERLAAEDARPRDTHVYLGLLAARRGDRVGAAQAIAFVQRTLNEVAPPSYVSRDDAVYVSAEIAAVLGDRDRAVEILRDVLSDHGFAALPIRLHRDHEWEPMRGYPPFRTLTRSRETGESAGRE